ncbi:hypothetical protein D3C81_942980 [compost metagenome]
MRPGVRVLDRPVARQLVGLESMFAAALPIGLPGDGAEAAARFTDVPAQQAQVDVLQRMLHAVHLLLQTPRGQDDPAFRPGESPGHLPDRFLRDPGEDGHSVGRERPHSFLHRFNPFRMFGHEFRIVQPLFQDHMQQPAD